MVEQTTAPEAQAPEVRYSPDDLASGALIGALMLEKFGPPEAEGPLEEHLERCVLDRFCRAEIQAEVETFGGPGTMGELSIHADYYGRGYLAALNDLGILGEDLRALATRLQEAARDGQ